MYFANVWITYTWLYVIETTPILLLGFIRNCGSDTVNERW